MKKTRYYILCILVGCMVFAFKKDSDKTYTVTYSVQDWQHKIDIIEAAKNYLKQSDVPIKACLPLIDSLSKIQSDFIGQLKPQIADTTKHK